MEGWRDTETLRTMEGWQGIRNRRRINREKMLKSFTDLKKKR